MEVKKTEIEVLNVRDPSALHLVETLEGRYQEETMRGQGESEKKEENPIIKTVVITKQEIVSKMMTEADHQGTEGYLQIILKEDLRLLMLDALLAYAMM